MSDVRDAAFKGDLEGVKRYVRADPACATRKDQHGYTPLLFAACRNRLPLVQWLLEEGGASVDERNNQGCTPLLVAAEYDSLAVVQWLLEEGGASVDERDNHGKTCFDLACTGWSGLGRETKQWLEQNRERLQREAAQRREGASAAAATPRAQQPSRTLRRAQAAVPTPSTTRAGHNTSQEHEQLVAQLLEQQQTQAQAFSQEREELQRRLSETQGRLQREVSQAHEQRRAAEQRAAQAQQRAAESEQALEQERQQRQQEVFQVQEQQQRAEQRAAATLDALAIAQQQLQQAELRAQHAEQQLQAQAEQLQHAEQQLQALAGQRQAGGVAGTDPHELVASLPQLPADLSLAHFNIHRRLGARSSRAGFYGGMGAVFEATLRDQPDCSPLAVKLLMNVEQVQTHQVEAHFAAEYELLERLPQHRNIMRQYQRFVSQGVPFTSLPDVDWDAEFVRSSTLCIVSELLGTSLQTAASQLHRERAGEPTLCPEPIFFQIMFELLSGVVHLHRHRVVHRDLKPDNIMLTADSLLARNVGVKIVDFGMALDCEAEDLEGFQLPFRTRHTSRGGAPGYIAPEIMTATHGRKVVLDYGKNDVFAAGVVAYQLLMGTDSMPFGTVNHDHYSRDTFAGMREAYSEGCRAFVWSLLEPDPAQRRSAEQAMVDARQLLCRC